MKIPMFQVDAFASTLFKGNPAAVCMLEKWVDDALLLSIAAENNLSETAFLVEAKDSFEIRWFTPTTEVALCGHATLASAFVLLEHIKSRQETVRFKTRMSGDLEVAQKNGLLEMDFPSRPPKVVIAPPNISDIMGSEVFETLDSAEDLLVLIKTENDIKALEPDISAISNLKWRGLIATAKGESCDFVSRCFFPAVGIPEDPVTGSAHCVLAPFWAQRLGKKDLFAKQLSKRGGELYICDLGERVSIAGKAVLYFEGAIYI